MTEPQRSSALRPEHVLGKAVLAAASRLGVRGRHLADVLGMSEATISRVRRRPTVDPASKAGEMSLLFLRLFRSLDALVGGNDMQAQAWLRGENAHTGGVPIEQIRTVEGLVNVVQYLDGMRGRL